jgi:biotin transport system substrate-specific component
MAEHLETRGVVHTLAVAGGVVFLAGCTAVGAQLRIPLPFSPVPVTAQTFFVLVAGALLGRKLGPLSQVLYAGAACLLPGAAAGPLHLTAGYIIGFVAAAYLIGWIAGESRSYWRVAGAMALGSALIYLCGAAWLAGATGSLKPALLQGVVPFLPGDVVKLVAAAGLVTAGNGVRDRFRARRKRCQGPFPPRNRGAVRRVQRTTP